MANKGFLAALGSGKQTGERANNDFYATNPLSVQGLLTKEKVQGDLLEPCVGQGQIVDTLKQSGCDFNSIMTLDLIDRGYPNTVVDDFLTHDFGKQKFDWIVTNPPYKLAEPFIRKSYALLKSNGKMAFFLRIQFLESIQRYQLFQDLPLQKVYVFSKRQTPWKNGQQTNNGKKWASTICFAWFVWQKDYKGQPTIDWIK